jgi:molybdenum cofactor cytidylyltransferase
VASRAPAKNRKTMTDVAAIILAAGASTRFRAAAGPNGPTTKLVAFRDGEPLVRRVARAALASRATPVVVVTGHAREDVKATLDDLAVAFVHNPDFATGLATSLKTAVRALPPTARGAVILLGDMPLIAAKLVDDLIAAFDAHPDAKAVAPVFAGQRGNPVLIARALFDHVMKLDGDVGARRLLRAAGEDVVEVDVGDASVTFDVDTPDALGG